MAIVRGVPNFRIFTVEMSCKTTKPTKRHVLPEKTRQPGRLPSQVRDFAVDFRVAKVKLPSCQLQRI